MEKTNYSEEYAITYLPRRIAECVRRSAALYNGRISEIRLRTGCPVYITAAGKNVCCGAGVTEKEMYDTVRTLCGNSLYCHSETIKEGYICTPGGIRVGVCGRAVTEGGKVSAVTDITSVVMRIPHRFPGAADELCKLIIGEGFRGMMIYSEPGVGKTTALREICARLAARPYNLRVAVVDTRFEICASLGGELTVDALSGYPRSVGMEAAVRCLSPQLIVCDEIGNESDADAIVQSMGAGVPTVVSAHAGSISELLMKPYIGKLIYGGAFTYAVKIERHGNETEYSVKETESLKCLNT